MCVIYDLGEDLVWCLEVEDFARPVVEPLSDDVEVVLGVCAEVGSLGEILSDEAVGVFVAAALPGAVGIGEPDLDAGILGELSMSGHFGTAIICERFAHGHGHVIKGGLEGGSCGDRKSVV